MSRDKLLSHSNYTLFRDAQGLLKVALPKAHVLDCEQSLFNSSALSRIGKKEGLLAVYSRLGSMRVCAARVWAPNLSLLSGYSQGWLASSVGGNKYPNYLGLSNTIEVIYITKIILALSLCPKAEVPLHDVSELTIRECLRIIFCLKMIFWLNNYNRSAPTTINLPKAALGSPTATLLL